MTTEVLNGVRNFYGPRPTEKQFPSLVKTEGHTKQMEIPVKWDELPSFSADGSMVMEIPANSLLVSAKFHVTVAFAGADTATATTDYLDVGLYTSAGVAIDANGVMGVDALTDLTVGAWVDNGDAIGAGAGALLGESIGTDAGQVVVAISDGTATAGEGKLIIEYIDG